MKIKDITKPLIYLGLYSLLVIPFIVDTSLFFPYITGKAFYFRTIVEIIFLLWVMLAISESEYRPKKSPVLYAFGLFLISIFFSNILGIDRLNSFWSNFERMEGFVTLVHLFALFLVMSSVFKTEKNWFWFFNASVFASLIMAFTAINQIIENGVNYRVDTTLGNSSYLGIYMLVNAFLTLWVLSKVKMNWQKILFYGIVFLLQATVVFQTGTRGSILGLIGGLFLVFVLSLIFSKGNKVAKQVFAGGFLVLILFVSSLFIFKDSSFVKDFQGFNRLTNISISEGTAQARLVNWSIAWEGVKERPVLGWGQSNYNYVFDKYFNPKMFGQESWFDRTHNIIFDWLIAGGFLGLLFYLSITATALYLIWFKSKFSVFEKSILIGLLASYFVHNLFVFDNIVSYLLFFFVIAYVHSQNSSEVDVLQKDINENLSFVLVSLLIVLIPISIYSFNASPRYVAKNLIGAISIVANNNQGNLVFFQEKGLLGNLDIYKEIIDRGTLGTPEVRTRLYTSALSVLRIESIPDEDKQKFVQFTVEQLSQQIEKTPEDPRYPYLLAAFMLNIGQTDLAIEYVNQAINISPNRQIFQFLLSNAYLTKGEKDKAVEIAKFAYELEPSSDLAWDQYINLLFKADQSLANEVIKEEILEGDSSRVEKILLNNIKNNPDNLDSHISFAAFYMQLGEVEKSLNYLEETKEKFPEAEKQIGELQKEIESGGNPMGKTF